MPVNLRAAGEEGLRQDAELLVGYEAGLLDPLDEPSGGVAPTPIGEKEHGCDYGPLGFIGVDLDATIVIEAVRPRCR
ncbi:MAG TPA: hypothetical protein VM142_05575 [Acidimicrobiales bacterium]|nr:hypothetical protein [Acidimicrobiales bacterium]